MAAMQQSSLRAGGSPHEVQTLMACFSSYCLRKTACVQNSLRRVGRADFTHSSTGAGASGFTVTNSLDPRAESPAFLRSRSLGACSRCGQLEECNRVLQHAHVITVGQENTHSLAPPPPHPTLTNTDDIQRALRSASWPAGNPYRAESGLRDRPASCGWRGR